jgi:hypothetical protein
MLQNRVASSRVIATIEEAALTVVDRILDLAGLDVNTYRWGDA